jgi:hypothetical protein
MSKGHTFIPNFRVITMNLSRSHIRMIDWMIEQGIIGSRSEYFRYLMNKDLMELKQKFDDFGLEDSLDELITPMLTNPTFAKSIVIENHQYHVVNKAEKLLRETEGYP